MKKRMPFVVIVVVAFTLLMPAFRHGVLAQQSADDARLIDVRRQQINLNEARVAFTRAQAEADLRPAVELDAARVRLEQAQLSYQSAVLSLLALQPRLSIQEAVKRQDVDGRKFVQITLKNLTPAFDDARFQLLNNFEGSDPIPPELRTRDVTDIFVSIQATGGSGGDARSTIIGIPYETHIDRLLYGETRTMEFQLLRDVDSLIVATNYKGQTQESTVQLQQAETDNVLMMSSLQVSQEADLGSDVVFDLKLERSSVDVRRFRLKAVNLPRQISHNFLDTGRARLQQVNFQTGVTQQNLSLQMHLPDRTDGQIKMDEALEFWVLAMDDEAAQQFAEDRIYTEDEIERSRAGRVRLHLLPRGVGRIEVAAPSLFSEIMTGETVQTRMTLRNSGTRRLDNIKIRADAPLNWRVEVEPDIVETLEVNREAEVRFHMIPPTDAVVGDYEVRIKTESYSYDRAIPTEDKLYRVSIKSKPNVWATAGLFGGLLIILAGVAVFLVRLTRR